MGLDGFDFRESTFGFSTFDFRLSTFRVWPQHGKPREIPSKECVAVPPGSARSLREQPADRPFPELQVNRQPGQKHTYLAQEIP